MTLIEAKLLKDLKKGNHEAFKRIFDHYSNQLLKFSISYLKDRQVAEDIVQEVFFKIWVNRKTIKTDTSFQAYLFTITLNAVRKHFNKQTRQQEVKHDILGDLYGLSSDLDDHSDFESLQEKLDELIDRMPDRRRTVFIMKKIDGKSLKEIASELDIAQKTVEYHISEAMKFLKSEFEQLKTRGLLFFYLFVQE